MSIKITTKGNGLNVPFDPYLELKILVIKQSSNIDCFSIIGRDNLRGLNLITINGSYNITLKYEDIKTPSNIDFIKYLLENGYECRLFKSRKKLLQYIVKNIIKYVHKNVN